jgi:uridine kinase
VARQTDRIFHIIDGLIRKKENIQIIIEGNSAAGKSRLAALLASVYDVNLFHMDDFFLPENQKTPARLSEPGGNVDYERFKSEVVENITKRQSFAYRPFSCSTQELGEPVEIIPKPICIVEGSYSMHPKIGLVPDLSIFLSIDPDTQSQRILDRNGEVLHRRFQNEWIPMENVYFNAFRIREKCDVVLKIESTQIFIPK